MATNELEKLAAIKAKNIDDLIDILKKSGKKFETPVEDAVKNLYTGGGTGSIFVDMAKGLPKKVLRFGGKKIQSPKNPKKMIRVNSIGERITNKLNDATAKVQKTLYNADVKAGNFLDDRLKTNMFRTKQNFYTADTKNKLRGMVEVEIPKLTAPIEKAKDAVLPIAGSMAVASRLDKIYHKDKNEGGDAVVEEKMAMTKKDIIDKIADVDNNNSIQVNTHNIESSFDKMAKLANTTVEMLKTASSVIKEKDSENTKLASENEKLKLQITAMIREDRATKLASSMLQKRMIKKANYDSKVEEIMKLSDDAYEVLEKTVADVNLINKEAADGIDSLDYNDYISSGDTESEKRTLSGDIIKLSNQMK